MWLSVCVYVLCIGLETGIVESQSTQLESSMVVDTSVSETRSSGILNISKPSVSDVSLFELTSSFSSYISSTAPSPTVPAVSHTSLTSSMLSASKSVVPETFTCPYSSKCTIDSSYILLSPSMPFVSSHVVSTTNASVSVTISPTVSSAIYLSILEVSHLNISDLNISSTPMSVESTREVFTTSTYIPTTDTLTTSTVRMPDSTTLIPEQFNKLLDDRPVYLQFSISVKGSLTDDSQNITTYKIFEKGLTACYNSTPGFMSVTVIRFRKGSIIVDYDVRIRNPQSVEAAVNHINQNISAIIKQADEEIKEFEINRDQTKNLMTANISMIGETGEQAICQSFSDFCRFGYNCTFNTVGDRVEASCQSKCSQQSSFCGIHGQCYIDHRSEALKCRCDEEENYVYIGERCGNRMELVKLKMEYIILIASGSGGLFIIALIVVIICLLKRRKSQDQERKQKEDESLAIHRVVEEYPQLDRYNESHSSREFSDHRGNKWTENQYQSSLLDTRYFDGREHKVLRNDRGNETHPNPGYSLPPSNKSVYDYIDTSSRFEIKRPNVHIGRKF